MPDGAGADDQHVLAGFARRRGQLPSQPRLIASSPRKRSTELMPTGESSSFAAVTGALAGVVADAAHDRREGVVLRQVPPGAS